MNELAKTDARNIKIAFPDTMPLPVHANIVQLIQASDDLYLMFGFAEPNNFEKHLQGEYPDGVPVTPLARIVIPRNAARQLRDQLMAFPLEISGLEAQRIFEQADKTLENE